MQINPERALQTTLREFILKGGLITIMKTNLNQHTMQNTMTNPQDKSIESVKPENIKTECSEASSNQDVEFCPFLVARRNPQYVSSTVFCFNAPTVVFTLSKTSSQFVLELLSSKVDAHFNTILSKKQEKELTRISDLKLRALCKKISVLEDKALWIDDTEFQSVTELCEKCRQMKKEHQIGVVIIDDYYHLVGTEDDEDFKEKRDAASRQLCQLTDELGILTVAFANTSAKPWIIQ
jgi:replicative DNA helicase